MATGKSRKPSILNMCMGWRGANIVLVEATTDSNADLFAAIKAAASLPGVSVVSMSWGLNEYAGERALDSYFATPTGRQGVTFVAASGDDGGYSVDNNGNPTATPGILYPAASPNVLAAGGTTLNLNADSSYNSETAWSGSGGGTSLYEPEPVYQQGVQTTGFRTVPDVALMPIPIRAWRFMTHTTTQTIAGRGSK